MDLLLIYWNTKFWILDSTWKICTQIIFCSSGKVSFQEKIKSKLITISSFVCSFITFLFSSLFLNFLLYLSCFFYFSLFFFLNVKMTNSKCLHIAGFLFFVLLSSSYFFRFLNKMLDCIRSYCPFAGCNLEINQCYRTYHHTLFSRVLSIWLSVYYHIVDKIIFNIFSIPYYVISNYFILYHTLYRDTWRQSENHLVPFLTHYFYIPFHIFVPLLSSFCYHRFRSLVLVGSIKSITEISQTRNNIFLKKNEKKEEKWKKKKKSEIQQLTATLN